jgi:ketol-acid reductoisomerase
MRQILKEVQSGAFATEWISENQAGRPRFLALRKQDAEHPIEKIGKELRAMMSGIQRKD